MDRNRDNTPENTAAGTVRHVGEAAAYAAERVGESLDQGRAALMEMQTVFAERTRECVRATDIYVRDNPWQAVGIAAGIGMILGLLMARR